MLVTVGDQVADVDDDRDALSEYVVVDVGTIEKLGVTDMGVICSERVR
jgi:hypothetical protein